jgi:O-antigen ligase
MTTRYPLAPSAWLALAPLAVAALVVAGVTRGGLLLLLVLGLAAVAAAAVALSFRPHEIFLAWLAFAPFFQDTFGGTQGGHALRIAVYSAPPLLFVLWAAMSRHEGRASLVDFLPLLYLALVVGSAFFAPDSASPTQLYAIVGTGVIVYYFCAFGPLEKDTGRKVIRVFLLADSIIAVAVVLGKLGVRLGPISGVQVDQSASVSRAASTLGNPGVLGTYLGAAFVAALAVLLWNGPRSLRRLSLVVVVVTPPALALTLTRGPLIAAGAVALTMVAARSRTRWTTVLALAIAAVVLVAAWGTIASTSLYQKRFSNASNVQARVIIDRWSFRLTAEKPVLGWGYSSFDRVKRAAHFSAAPLRYEDVIRFTSHNTFLTILVETGIVGLFAMLVPWFVAAKAAFRSSLQPGDERWLLIALLAILSIWVINAGTLDMRFFSFVSALPWLAVGLMRRMTRLPQPADV